MNPDLAGGSLLDIGIYPLSITQFILQAEPEKIQAQAVLSRTGVDVYTAASLHYSSGVVAQFSANAMANTVDDLVITGMEGTITVSENFYMADKAILEVNGQRKRKFRGKLHCGGFEYQIEEAMACIRAGKIESDIMSHADSLGNMRVMDKIRAQIGVKYPFE